MHLKERNKTSNEVQLQQRLLEHMVCCLHGCYSKTLSYTPKPGVLQYNCSLDTTYTTLSDTSTSAWPRIYPRGTMYRELNLV
jgi:hypothetical protein